jgi:hypothetical protein
MKWSRSGHEQPTKQPKKGEENASTAHHQTNRIQFSFKHLQALPTITNQEKYKAQRVFKMSVKERPIPPPTRNAPKNL